MRITAGTISAIVPRFEGSKKKKDPMLKEQIHPLIVKERIISRLDRVFNVVQGERQPQRDFEPTLYTSWTQGGLQRAVEVTAEWDFDKYEVIITGYAWKDEMAEQSENAGAKPRLSPLSVRRWYTQTLSRVSVPKNLEQLKPESFKNAFASAQQRVNAWTEADLRLTQRYDF